MPGHFNDIVFNIKNISNKNVCGLNSYRGLQRPRIDFFSRVFRKKKLLQEIAALEATVSSDYEILVEMINSAAAQVLQEKSPGPMSDNSKKEE